jgi:tripartite-type tricarboxylate transporter receptor subunit TctC
MATYKNVTAAAVTFPTLKDADGNVLVVEAGATFEGPEGLTNSEIQLTTKAAKTVAADPDLTDTTETTKE